MTKGEELNGKPHAGKSQVRFDEGKVELSAITRRGSILYKHRNFAIDFLKFVAVLCIFNAHSTMLYPIYPWLSTGGYVGDALFFFCSGYTLLSGGGDRFDTWYKRRLSRIWPSCLAWGVLSAIVLNKPLAITDALAGIGWFVQYILVVYVVIWIVGAFFRARLNWIFSISVVLSVMCCVVCLVMDDKNPDHWKWPVFFPVVMLGALLGNNRYDGKSNLWVNFIMCVVSFGLFTSVVAGTSRLGIKYLALMEVPLLLAFVWFAYRLTCSMKLEEWSKGNTWLMVRIVGSLCLDFYLVKWKFISGALCCLFPLNLPIMLVYLLAIAYCNRSIGRFLQQSLSSKKEPYDWKAIFSLC